MECLARALFASNARPEYVIFTTYQERQDGTTRIGLFRRFSMIPEINLANQITDKTLKTPETPYPDLCAIYTSLWKEMDAKATVSVEPSIEGAINLAERISSDKGGAHVFVTGSLHLVGGALNLLRPQV